MKKKTEGFPMLKQYTVSRDDSVYECFPDVVKTKSGKLVCVFRESAHPRPTLDKRGAVCYNDKAKNEKTRKQYAFLSV